LVDIHICPSALCVLQINDPRRVPTPAELPLLEKLVNDSEQGQDVIITQLTISDKAQVWRHPP
jgi:hypothetical protein